MYLWRYSYVGRNSYKKFKCIYGGIHIYGGIPIRNSHTSMEVFIDREVFI